MDRSAALRASLFFIAAALAFGTAGVASGEPLAEAAFVIVGSLAALTAALGLVAPAPQPMRVRAQARRRLPRDRF